MSSRRQNVPLNMFLRAADPMPPLFDPPNEGDFYFNTTFHVMRIFKRDRYSDPLTYSWQDLTTGGSAELGKDTTWTYVGPNDPGDPTLVGNPDGLNAPLWIDTDAGIDEGGGSGGGGAVGASVTEGVWTWVDSPADPLAYQGDGKVWYVGTHKFALSVKDAAGHDHSLSLFNLMVGDVVYTEEGPTIDTSNGMTARVVEKDQIYGSGDELAIVLETTKTIYWGTDGEPFRVAWWFDSAAGTGESSGHVIQDEGVPLAARAGLNFIGAGVSVTDDPAGGRTSVAINAAPSYVPNPAGQPDGKHLEVKTGAYVFVNRPIVYSATPPSSPADGDVWIERST